MLFVIDAILLELLLFAAVGIAIGGIDDLAVDIAWIGRRAWRSITVYRRHPRASLACLSPPRAPGAIAVMVCAWQESEVIERMLREALSRYDHGDYRIYVGTYPNDPETIAAVRAVDDLRIRLAIGPNPGPTTKGDNLNRIWQAILADERTEGRRFKAVVLHDAEDRVHPGELRLFDHMIERFAVVQIPVIPLPHPRSRWIAGHYCDEFAEAHRRMLSVREALGAGVPLAGVGCAISRTAIERLSQIRNGLPFDPASLTEDYELGLHLAQLGCHGRFVVLPETPGGPPVAVRSLFPDTPGRAVRQKARWMLGIALAGWDRLGWHGSLAEHWMRMRDRRALIAALILSAAYGALLLAPFAALGHLLADTPPPTLPPVLRLLLDVNMALLVWRGAMRWRAVRHHYGDAEAWRSLLRIPVSNGIAILAARRGLIDYVAHLRGAPLRWDKTPHHFPEPANQT